MLKYIMAAGAVAFATPAFASCDTAQVAQDNIRRQEAYSGVGRTAAGILGRSELGRSLRGVGVGRGDLRRAGSALGVQMAGPLTRGLDQCDQAWLTGSTTQALDTKAETSWSNRDSGAAGENRIVATPVSILRANPGKDCRTVEQYITLSDGSSRVQNVTACRAGDGAWEVIS